MCCYTTTVLPQLLVYVIYMKATLCSVKLGIYYLSLA